MFWQLIWQLAQFFKPFPAPNSWAYEMATAFYDIRITPEVGDDINERTSFEGKWGEYCPPVIGFDDVWSNEHGSDITETDGDDRT